jgi:hypothetical protein
MEALLNGIKEVINFILQLGILGLILIIFVGYTIVPIFAGKKVFEVLSEKLDRTGNGVYMIWGGAVVGGVLALVAVHALISLAGGLVGGDSGYFLKMATDYIAKVAGKV